MKALATLEAYIGQFKIDNGDDRGLHHPSNRETKLAANVLQSLPGAPKICNYRQLLAWSHADGLDAIIDA